MAEANAAVAGAPLPPGGSSRPHLDTKPGPAMALFFLILIGAGVFYSGFSLITDITDAEGERTTTWLPFVLLGIALLIALGFEFVNGVHDTANAVATVIYTHSLPPNLAVDRKSVV